MFKSRLIEARFNGKCRACGKSVLKGEQVFFAKHYGVRCLSCGPHTESDERLPSKRKSGRRQPAAEQPARPRKSARPTSPEDPESRAGQRCSDGVHRYEFYSIGEAVEDALSDYAQNDSNRAKVRVMQGSALSGHSRWGNYFTRERLLDELSHPSQDLLRAVDQMRERLIGALDLPTTPRRKVRRGLDWGDELDADRWLVRDPNGWERSVREAQPRRTVTIGCNISVNAGVKPEQLLYRGAAALALADVLVQRGFNVGIVLFKSVHQPTRTVEWGLVRYTAKDPTMPLDLSAVAFAMCEIAFSRAVAVCGGMRHWPGVAREGWGSSVKLPAADREGIDYLIDADCLSREAAEAWLGQQLQSEVAHV